MTRALNVRPAVPTVVALVVLLGLSLQAASRAPKHPTPPRSPHEDVDVVGVARPFVDRYCVTCHNLRLKTAGLVLETISLDDIGAQAEVWEKVVRKLRTRAMPPVGAPRPDESAYDAVAEALEHSLDRAFDARPNPGRTDMHRLNRAEYANAVRDLFDLDVDARSLLPADDVSYGFDNIADVLSISPGLLERYVGAAQKISRLVVGRAPGRASVEIYKSSPLLLQGDRVSEDLPVGSRGGIVIRHYFPVSGEYVCRVHLQRAALSGGIRGLGDHNTLDVRVDGARAGLLPISEKKSGGQEGESPEPSFRLAMQAGRHVLGLTFLERRMWIPERAGPEHYPPKTASFSTDFTVQMGIATVEIDGPYDGVATDTPSRRRIFVCHPAGASEEDACARRIVSKLAERAFRRPLVTSDVQDLLKRFRAGRAEDGFESGIQAAVEAILVSPEFLFRIERDHPADASRVFRISGVDLASRLSFFLWSSIPDAELLAAARRGELHEPRQLEAQVRRMLADPRASALMENFGGQWLYLRNLRLVSPDPEAFPQFDDNLRDAFQRETELFLQAQLRDDRPVTELLSADYTFVNERLARFYGVPGVRGDRFRRVPLPDNRRGGLLGQGSILTVTSYPTRTSPVQRGKWVLENLLAAPPPPPPPNVPGLPERESGGRPRSVRERMEQHRRNPVCASCHARMDPIGFALENYDGIGAWRAMDGTLMLDVSGSLPDGTAFTGPGELRAALLGRERQLATTVIEKLMTYALGRGVEYYDMPSIRRILRDASSDRFRWSSLILGIVTSTPFQMRRAES